MEPYPSQRGRHHGPKNTRAMTASHGLIGAPGKRGRIFSIATVKREFFCNSQCGPLVCLQSNLLGEHHVASNKTPVWNKAEAHNWLAIMVSLVTVCWGTLNNAIPLSALAADNLKRSGCIVLPPLLLRKPFSEQC